MDVNSSRSNVHAGLRGFLLVRTASFCVHKFDRGALYNRLDIEHSGEVGSTPQNTFVSC